MEYVIIGVCIVAAIAVGIVLYLKNKPTKDEPENTAVVAVSPSNTELQTSEAAKELVIQMELLPAEAIPDESKLVEITDSKVLAHVNNLVPGLAQAGNAVNNAAQAAKANGEVLYRAIIPAGAKLTDSKTMEGAVRGIYHGADGIKGHANLVAVEAQKGTAVVANTAAATMGVASMVVGQYYMTQINAELGVISDGISQIQDFQDNEYRSRIFSLVAHVKKIADFQTEILENNELRLSKISQLDSLEEECTQLLGQANLTNNDVNIPTYLENDLALELEKLKQYGMISSYGYYISGCWNLTILPCMLTYFERKEIALMEEKKAFNTNNFYGNVTGVQIQQGTINSTQNQNITQDFDFDAVSDVIKNIKNYDAMFESEFGDDAAELRNKLDEIERLIKNKENPSKIKALLLELKNLAVGVTGSLIASGIAAQIPIF